MVKFPASPDYSLEEPRAEGARQKKGLLNLQWVPAGAVGAECHRS